MTLEHHGHSPPGQTIVFGLNATHENQKWLPWRQIIGYIVLETELPRLIDYGVAERCRFVREGRLRGQVNRKDGTLVAKLCYGMLRTEFETLNG